MMHLPQILAVEAGSEYNAVLQAELLHHIMLHPGSCSGSQCQQGHAWVSAINTTDPICILFSSVHSARQT